MLLLACVLSSVAASCPSSSDYVEINLNAASIRRANLGGLGGRCATPGRCLELESASTPAEIYLENVATLLEADGASARIDLRITNESLCTI